MRDASLHSNYISHTPVHVKPATPYDPSNSAGSSNVAASVLSAVTQGAVAVPAYVSKSITNMWPAFPSPQRKRISRKGRSPLGGHLQDEDPLVRAEDEQFQNKVVSVLVLVGVLMLILIGGTAIIALEAPSISGSGAGQTTDAEGSATSRIAQLPPLEHDEALMKALHDRASSTIDAQPSRLPSAPRFSEQLPASTPVSARVGPTDASVDGDESPSPPASEVGSAHDALPLPAPPASKEKRLQAERVARERRKARGDKRTAAGAGQRGTNDSPHEHLVFSHGQPTHNSAGLPVGEEELQQPTDSGGHPGSTHDELPFPFVPPARHRAIRGGRYGGRSSHKGPLKRRYGPTSTHQITADTPVYAGAASKEPIGTLASKSIVALASPEQHTVDVTRKRGRTHVLFQPRDLRASLNGGGGGLAGQQNGHLQHHYGGARGSDVASVVPLEDSQYIGEGWLSSSSLRALPPSEWRRFALAVERRTLPSGEPEEWARESDHGEVWRKGAQRAAETAVNKKRPSSKPIAKLAVATNPSSRSSPTSAAGTPRLRPTPSRLVPGAPFGASPASVSTAPLSRALPQLQRRAAAGLTVDQAWDVGKEVQREIRQARTALRQK